MQIQPAEPRMLEAVQRLLATTGLPYDDLTPSHMEHFFVCRGSNGICGVVGMELYDTVALLRSLVVAPEHRTGGIGTRLTEEVEQYARRAGTKAVYLLTTTASDYFARRGYRKIDRDALPEAIRETEEARRLCPSGATCMRKYLDVPAEETD